MKEAIRRLCITPEDSVRDAMSAIDAGGRQIALVLDGNGRLVATVTDGDIRRGLLKGMGLDDAVRGVMHAKPATVTENDGPEAARWLMRALRLHHIPVVDEAGILLDLAWIDEISGLATRETRVILMAGGLGTRLRPLTESVPKPMLPVGDRPLLEHIVRNLIEQGFRRFTLSVNYRADMVEAHFGDGSALGAEIGYVHETERMGTAGALSLLPERPEAPFIVMNADLLTSLRFESALQFHEETGAEATMCAREYSMQVPYGVIRADGARLVAIEEKPVESYFVNAGIYVLSPAALDLLEPGRPCDMPTFFDRLMARGSQISVFPISEYWTDIGQREDLERARVDFEQVFGK